MKRIAIVDYGLGNVGSIANMLRKIGAQGTVTSDPAQIAGSDKLILSGVGAFDVGMENLKARGLMEVLDDRVRKHGVNILGICLGMQLLGKGSMEGTLPGFGWLDAEAVSLKSHEELKNLRVPHMGWNRVRVCRPHPLFANLENYSRFYFAHSYHMVCNNEEDVLAATEYGLEFASSVAWGNVMGVQFHPEKSHRFGMQLLRNFAELN